LPHDGFRRGWLLLGAARGGIASGHPSPNRCAVCSLIIFLITVPTEKASTLGGAIRRIWEAELVPNIARASIGVAFRIWQRLKSE